MKQNDDFFIINQKEYQDLLVANNYELVCNEMDFLCSKNSNDSLRTSLEKQYGKMNEQEFFECKQNLFNFFALLDDISQEQETKQLKEKEEVGGSNVDN